MNSKTELIRKLVDDHYLMLKPSAIHGIGVFAIRPIPKGCKTMFGSDPGEWIALSKTEFENLPEHTKLLIENYCLFDLDQYYVPAKGFKQMDLSFFLNHSDQANIRSVNDGEFFETIRDIQTGEELTLDYGTICEYE